MSITLVLSCANNATCGHQYLFQACAVEKNLIEDVSIIKLMKGKALRKHSLHEKTAASVLLKLFISGNE